MKDDKEEVDFGKHDCEYKSENLYEDDSSHESHHLTGKLKVSEDMIIAAIKHFDDTHKLMENCCWKEEPPGTHKNFEGELSLAYFQALREALVVMKSNYLHLLSDRDHLLMLDEIYFDALKGKEEEVDKLTHGLKVTKDSLKSTQMALQESEIQVDELCVELSLAHSSSSTAETQSSMAAITHEDVSGTHDLREEPLVMVKHEEHSDLHGLEERYDSKISDYTHSLHHGDHEPPLLEGPLKAQVIAIDEIVEHIPCGPTNREVYASTDCGNGYIKDVDTTIWDPGSDDTSGVNA
jgi:hypothetical protein